MCVCVCVKQSADRVLVRRSKRTLTAPTIVSLSFSLSLRFNLNAQICNGYNGKRGFCWCKKREKRTTLLCEKETRLQQSKVQVKTISLSFSHFLSLFLSLSFTPLFVVLLFVSSERARCAVEADTINERFYSRTFSVISSTTK